MINERSIRIKTRSHRETNALVPKRSNGNSGCIHANSQSIAKNCLGVSRTFNIFWRGERGTEII